ncbi:MAG: tRNA (N(6)-L-threonylcarbamoyladenosine(37)-C(2))-methylthiotransferase MtaB [Alloprevotella sp.]|nr:tRNA (N(6)-L-threonylcarbamoyladenosine(37)-C(2))-methylthiotransferase MtaB [Alloprevotella sp.]
MTTPRNPLLGLKATFRTLGCKLNFAETSALADRLKAEGVSEAAPGETADLCVVNTCSVTETADSKCRQTIRHIVREHPSAFVVVMGCYAQLKPDEVARLEGVDLVVGTEQKARIIDLVKQGLLKRQTMDDGHNLHEAVATPMRDIRTFVPSCSRGNRTRYFLKVQDGCNYFCTYCTIPAARGRSRNGSIAMLADQARRAADAGAKEIVLTGVNIGDYGRSTGEDLLSLLRELDTVEGIERYRISSIEPNLLTEPIIEFCAQSRAFMPHFHIPLQCGNDEVLRLMRRRYTTELFASRVERIHALMPDAFIGVDVIVGMRGETDSLFEQAYAFIKGLDVSQLHVFNYSERPGTKALQIPHKVSPAERQSRSRRLIELSERKRLAFYRRHIGQTRPVLWEQSAIGAPMHGFTDNYIRIELPEARTDLDNQISMVRLGSLTPDQQSLIAAE